MESSSTSRPSPDEPSTSGRRSSSRLLLEDLRPVAVVSGQNANDTAVAQLLNAVASGDISRTKKWAKMLLRTGLDAAVAAVEDPKSKRHGPLHLAAGVGDSEMCKLLIKTYKCDVNATGIDGGTPLHFAVLGNGSVDAARVLINKNADPNKGDNSGITPLHNAAELGLYEVAKFLLSRGVTVDPVSDDGETPLHIAAENGNAKMLKLLLEHNADCNRLSHKSYAPLVKSLSCSSLECMKILIEAGVDVNIRGPVTPLVVAASKGLSDRIECLLKAGADANISDDEGKMAIEIAAYGGWEECVKILFPFTNPLAKYPVWSIEEIVQHERLRAASEYNAKGDAAFLKVDYILAAALYSMALKLDPNSTLYAKRSLCLLRLGDKENALADLKVYKDMEPDLSNAPSASLTLVEDYGRELEALMSGLNMSSGSGLTIDTDESI